MSDVEKISKELADKRAKSCKSMNGRMVKEHCIVKSGKNVHKIEMNTCSSHGKILLVSYSLNPKSRKDPAVVTTPKVYKSLEKEFPKVKTKITIDEYPVKCQQTDRSR